jgi:dephospho-CoA kinase
MLKVGLTGGLASGKSFVAQALADLGCHLIKADDIGREIMQPGGEAFDAVVKEFGPGILTPGGSIDRKRLAAEVFSRPERLAALNRLVHPPVIRRQDELMEALAARDPKGIAVVEAAIIIEAGTYRRFDKLILAVCSQEQQIERAMLRDGIGREGALERLRSQMPLEEKRQFADYVIDTSGSREETLRQAAEVYNRLQSLS